MATKTEEFLTGTGTTIGFTTQYINESDIKVRVDGGSPLTFIGTTGTPSTGEYKIAANSTTITFGDNQNGKSLHIYSETDVTGPTVTFTPGSSIKAADLNSIETLVRHGIQESRNEIVTHDIRDSQITSSKIVDGTIVDADINASAAIAQTKIATGTLPSGIQVASANIVDGSIVNDDVSNSANISGSKIADASIPVAKIASGTLPSNTKVTSANIEDGTIVNADVNSSAAVDGTKISPNFGNQNVITTGTGATGNLNVGGSITVSGNVDGRDVAADGTKLDTIETNAKDDQTATEIKTLYESNNNTNEFSNAEQSKLQGIEVGATADQTAAEIRTLVESASDSNVFTDADHTKLNGIETAATADQTASEIKTLLQSDKLTLSEMNTSSLDSRYFTETELTGGALDGRYYTETEAEARFLRQDSSETIASGATWSNSDAFVATTAAINARIVDLIDEVGGFTAIANETSFPATNPQGATGQAAILSIAAASATLTPSGTTLTIPNGAGTGNTVTVTGVPTAIPQNFGFLVESTSTTHTYTFHRLVPIATQVNTVAQNITNIVAAGANVTDINNFVDIYQISNSAPTQRADGTSLQVGDLWFDNANDTLRVYDGTNWAIISPSQTVLNDISIVSGAITYQEDLGLISDAVSTGSSNGSLDIVADIIEDEITFTTTVVNSGGNKYVIDGDTSNPAKALTLYKGWTYTFDQSDSSNANHPLVFKTDSGAYTTNVTVTGTAGQAGAKVQIVIPETQPTGNFRYYCSVHGNAMGNLITVKDDPIKTVSDNITNINTVASDLTEGTSEIDTVATNITNVNAVGTNISNVNAVNSNATNINSAVSNATNINSVAGSITNVNTVANNISSVNSFANTYRIASSAPTSSLDQGDLYFDTTSNELRVYNGSSWQGGVTATGNLAGLGANTFTGDQTVNANIIISGTVDGKDVSTLIANVVEDTTPQLGGTLDGQNNNMSNIGTIDGTNLQLDFGTL